MKTTVIAVTLLGLMAATSAVAGSRATDVDYLRANRCKGLAVVLGSTDTAGLDAWIKAEGRSRLPAVVDRAESELARAKREARDANLKDKLSAELAGPCLAYLGGKDMAAR
jgi:hypothetical protein